MLVIVERPSLNEPAIANVEDKRLQAVQPAPLPFALRDVHPDGMLVAGDSIMQGDPEGPSRTLGQGPEKGEHLVDALVVTGDRVAARLVEDRIVGEQLPERLDVASGESVVASTNQVLVGMGHGRTSCPRGGGNAMPFPDGGRATRWRQPPYSDGRTDRAAPVRSRV
jgi:hypothetical protein